MPETAQTKVYKYIVENEPEHTFYWKIEFNPSEDQIITTNLDNDFNPVDKMYETLTASGAELTKFFEYNTLENGEIVAVEAIVRDKDIVKWSPSKSYQYRVQTPSDEGDIHMIKIRDYQGLESVIWKGEERKVVKFKGYYYFKYPDYEGMYHMYQFSYYTPDIGMIMFERYIQNESKTFVLENILSLEEFEALKAGN